MANGKIRSESHLIDAKAQNIITNIFPNEWVCRTMNPDYGIDCDLELFEQENGQYITLGEHLFLQIKGTKNASYIRIRPYNDINSNTSHPTFINVLSFPIDVPLLKLVKRMGSAIPVILIVTDVNTNKAFYVCLNDYCRFILPLQCPNFSSQKTVNIHIPMVNILDSKNLDIFRWYAKRPKLYDLFQRLTTASNDANYLSGQELITYTKTIIDEVINFDAWNAKNSWSLINIIHDTMKRMSEHDMISNDGEIFINHHSHGGNPKEVQCYMGSFEQPKIVYTAAQEWSCFSLFDNIKTVCGVFDSETQRAFLPLHY